MKKLKPEQQKRIDAICRKYHRKMQAIVDESHNLTGISMQVGDGPKIQIAKRKRADK